MLAICYQWVNSLQDPKNLETLSLTFHALIYYDQYQRPLTEAFSNKMLYNEN